MEEIIRESAIDKEEKTPGLKFNPGLVLIGLRTTGPSVKLMSHKK